MVYELVVTYVYIFCFSECCQNRSVSQECESYCGTTSIFNPMLPVDNIVSCYGEINTIMACVMGKKIETKNTMLSNHHIRSNNLDNKLCGYLKTVISTKMSILSWTLPPPQQPSGRMLASSVGGPGFNPQSRLLHTKDVLKMVPVVPLFGTHH